MSDEVKKEAAPVTIPGVKVRVHKESGLTELFVTSTEPLMNWSTHLPGDVALESRAYDLTFTPVKEAPPPPPTETQHVEDGTKIVGTAGTQPPAAPAEPAPAGEEPGEAPDED